MSGIDNSMPDIGIIWPFFNNPGFLLPIGRVRMDPLRRKVVVARDVPPGVFGLAPRALHRWQLIERWNHRVGRAAVPMPAGMPLPRFFPGPFFVIDWRFNKECCDGRKPSPPVRTLFNQGL